jgi:hypothetical protein
MCPGRSHVSSEEQASQTNDLFWESLLGEQFQHLDRVPIQRSVFGIPPQLLDLVTHRV